MFNQLDITEAFQKIEDMTEKPKKLSYKERIRLLLTPQEDEHSEYLRMKEVSRYFNNKIRNFN